MHDKIHVRRIILCKWSPTYTQDIKILSTTYQVCIEDGEEGKPWNIPPPPNNLANNLFQNHTFTSKWPHINLKTKSFLGMGSWGYITPDPLVIYAVIMSMQCTMNGKISSEVTVVVQLVKAGLLLNETSTDMVGAALTNICSN